MVLRIVQQSLHHFRSWSDNDSFQKDLCDLNRPRSVVGICMNHFVIRISFQSELEPSVREKPSSESPEKRDVCQRNRNLSFLANTENVLSFGPSFIEFRVSFSVETTDFCVIQGRLEVVGCDVARGWDPPRIDLGFSASFPEFRNIKTSSRTIKEGHVHPSNTLRSFISPFKSFLKMDCVSEIFKEINLLTFMIKSECFEKTFSSINN